MKYWCWTLVPNSLQNLTYIIASWKQESKLQFLKIKLIFYILYFKFVLGTLNIQLIQCLI